MIVVLYVPTPRRECWAGGEQEIPVLGQGDGGHACTRPVVAYVLTYRHRWTEIDGDIDTRIQTMGSRRGDKK